MSFQPTPQNENPDSVPEQLLLVIDISESFLAVAKTNRHIMHQQQCFRVVEEKTTLDIGIGWFLVVGTILSYLPQCITIVKSRSIVGVSWLSPFIGVASIGGVLLNATILQWDSISCCLESSVSCSVISLDILVIVANWLFNLIIFLEWLYVAKYLDSTKPDYRVPSWCLLLCTGFLIFATSILLFLADKFGMQSIQVRDFAYVCTTVASIIYIPKRVPQIIETWRLKKVGSFSVTTLLIQTPGTWLLLYFQAVSYRSSWTTWFPFLVVAVQEGVLLVMCCYLMGREWMEKQKQKNLEAAEELERLKEVL